ncbi:MAG: hypothetical protein WCB04_09705 [Mycobacteriales bacterium]
MTTPPNAPPPADGYGAPPPAGGATNNTPMILGVIGIVCWFFCSPAAIALGLIGAQKARQSGQSDTLPKIAWIGGIAFLALGIVYAVAFRK